MHETWIPGESFLHRWDPRCKLIGIALLCLLPTALSGLVRPLALFLAGLALLWLCRLSTGLFFRRLAVIHFFFIPCFILIPFSSPGETFFRLGPLQATTDGLVFAAGLYLRAVAITTFALGLVLSTPFEVVVQAAERLRVPRILTQITLLAYRFLFAFRADWRRIRIALRTRGFREATRMHAYRALANAVGGLMLRAFDRTERVTHAMRCRGYRRTLPTLRDFHLHGADVGAVVVCAAVCGVFLYWEFGS